MRKILEKVRDAKRSGANSGRFGAGPQLAGASVLIAVALGCL
ncbi:MAG TPA: hypothetical protein PKD05_07250 [Candidatus Melainabacteria bacterium]|nr:hypothetical protein [Candidatus Melainabacteria bacterium]HMP51338.1 hypothetical protein [Candidatus Melainabacteria bacterium]